MGYFLSYIEVLTSTELPGTSWAALKLTTLVGSQIQTKFSVPSLNQALKMTLLITMSLIFHILSAVSHEFLAVEISSMFSLFSIRCKFS